MANNKKYFCEEKFGNKLIQISVSSSMTTRCAVRVTRSDHRMFPWCQCLAWKRKKAHGFPSPLRSLRLSHRIILVMLYGLVIKQKTSAECKNMFGQGMLKCESTNRGGTIYSIMMVVPFYCHQHWILWMKVMFSCQSNWTFLSPLIIRLTIQVTLLLIWNEWEMKLGEC